MDVLADRIADRLVQRFISTIAELAASAAFGAAAVGPSPDGGRTAEVPEAKRDGVGGLWTARRLAAHYGVAVSFVYEHADELGCVRLGGGRCPRLRFDPRVVRERWPTVGQPDCAPAKSRTRPVPRRRAQNGASDRGYELLEFERHP